MVIHPLPVFVRWVHVVSAAALVGGLLLYELGIRKTWIAFAPESRQASFGRVLRVLKMTVHATFLLFLLSGAYNAIRYWPIYTKNPAVMHALFGMHALLGLSALVLLVIMFAGKELNSTKAGWSRIALVLLLLGIALSSTLKSAREWTISHPTAPANMSGSSVR